MKKLIRELQEMVINSEIMGLMINVNLGVCVNVFYSGLHNKSKEYKLNAYAFYKPWNLEESKKDLEELKKEVEKFIKSIKND